MRITVAERRARLGVRHRLAKPAATVEEAVRSVVVLHATDPATVFLSAAGRTESAGPEPVERALFEDRTLVRMHGMRRTLFVVPAELVPVVQRSSTAAIAVRERRNLLKQMSQGGLSWTAEQLAEVEASVLRVLAERGELGTADLAAAEPRLNERMRFAVGKSYEATQTVGSRLLPLMAMDGALVRRGRAGGTWVSALHTWAVTPAELTRPELTAPEAQAELVRLWLAAFGPGTEADVKWWTGWTLGEVRRALAAVGAVPVELEEGTGYVLPDDLEPVDGPEPWAALLPALDPTPMGWQQRDWYLPEEHRAALFDRSGNIGPTVWWNGRIVGGWATRPGGEIVWELLEDVGAEARTLIEAEAAALAKWLGGTKITPRFRTPLERRLSHVDR
ncbi:winged helix DNA-binding domain-containing protein [Thermoactinospora rubra]|uniref:winged helix DNA-binding domain-containing protein n=1 Tax=Thermoactinospora rubra TaxID=1088767 RepID=UPI001F0A249F|nr:winged helix DNA-binding domain-containing protein [Thermoactinospora rubra]